MGAGAVALLSLLTVSAKLQKQAMNSGAVSVEGAELHYFTEGRGLPCLVIGHAESSRLLLSQSLRNHFQFTFVDLRHDARSKSSLQLSKITLGTYLDDIDEVVRALGLGRFAIWGHSHHAYLSLQYARKYPKKVSHVIVTGCTPCDIWHSKQDEFWESDASVERKTLFDLKWGEYLKHRSRMSAEERATASLVASAPKLLWDLSDNLAFVEVAKAIRNNLDVYLRYQTTILKDYDIAKERGRIEAPVFLALGRYDYVAPYILWEERRGALPNLSSNVFYRSGHFPMFEEQQLFDDKLIDWIRK